ncbi:MAG: hypothetical protein IKN12_05160 [Selenomonadaceae bacterium]|nr:hypothetical protein [Selenomonadaceae bacterium]
MLTEKEYAGYGVTYTDVMKRLKLSHSYVVHRITNNVKHLEGNSSKGKQVFFDPNDIRRFLLDEATFTRQTKLVNIKWEMDKYKKSNPEKNFTKTEFVGEIPEIKKQKRELPEIPVEPFDFWDMTLVFPKEYNKNPDSSKFVNMEYCYRDMFAIGAIKIKLGAQKTIFCFKNDNRGVKTPDLTSYEDIKNTYKNTDYLLVPADWKPFYKVADLSNANADSLKAIKYLREQDFDTALQYLTKNDKLSLEDSLDFMKVVVKEHGTNPQIINNAIEAVVNANYETTEFSVKLLQEIRKTEEYQTASATEQSKKTNYSL